MKDFEHTEYTLYHVFQLLDGFIVANRKLPSFLAEGDDELDVVDNIAHICATFPPRTTNDEHYLILEDLTNNAITFADAFHRLLRALHKAANCLPDELVVGNRKLWRIELDEDE